MSFIIVSLYIGFCYWWCGPLILLAATPLLSLWLGNCCRTATSAKVCEWGCVSHAQVAAVPRKNCSRPAGFLLMRSLRRTTCNSRWKRWYERRLQWQQRLQMVTRDEGLWEIEKTGSGDLRDWGKPTSMGTLQLNNKLHRFLWHYYRRTLLYLNGWGWSA